jgi:hypothetical protein
MVKKTSFVFNRFVFYTSRKQILGLAEAKKLNVAMHVAHKEKKTKARLCARGRPIVEQ